MKLEIEDTELIELLAGLKDRIKELEKKVEQKEKIVYVPVDTRPYYPWLPHEIPWREPYITWTTVSGTTADLIAYNGDGCVCGGECHGK